MAISRCGHGPVGRSRIYGRRYGSPSAPLVPPADRPQLAPGGAADRARRRSARPWGRPGAPSPTLGSPGNDGAVRGAGDRPRRRRTPAPRGRPADRDALLPSCALILGVLSLARMTTYSELTGNGELGLQQTRISAVEGDPLLERLLSFDPRFVFVLFAGLVCAQQRFHALQKLTLAFPLSTVDDMASKGAEVMGLLVLRLLYFHCLVAVIVRATRRQQFGGRK